MRDPGADSPVYALVDDQDFPLVSRRRWTLRKGYAMGNTRHRRRKAWRLGRGWDRIPVLVGMHRVILGLDAGDPRRVVHLNRDRLDNRRTNLVIGPARRTRSRASASSYRGVRWDEAQQKWQAVVWVDGEPLVISLHDEPTLAAIAAWCARNGKPANQAAWQPVTDEEMRALHDAAMELLEQSRWNAATTGREDS